MTTIKFICPYCAAEHERGYLDGVYLAACRRHPDATIEVVVGANLIHRMTCDGCGKLIDNGAATTVNVPAADTTQSERQFQYHWECVPKFSANFSSLLPGKTDTAKKR